MSSKTLDRVLEAAAPPSAPGVHHVDGILAADADPHRFRLYPDPADRERYLLVRKVDVVGDPHEWTASARAGAGFAGPEAVHRILVVPEAVILELIVRRWNPDLLVEQERAQVLGRQLSSLSNLMKSASDSSKNVIHNTR